MYDKHGIGNKGKTYTCGICGQVIRNKTAFRAHEAKHQNIREYKCDKCDKAYGYKKDLEIHKLNKHSNAYNKPSCPICHKTFSYPGSVTKHIQYTHSDSPPRFFTCVVHNKSYTSKAALARHFRSHKPDEETEGNIEQAVEEQSPKETNAASGQNWN